LAICCNIQISVENWRCSVSICKRIHIIESVWRRRGRHRMVVGFTTTYAISAYYHWCCEFERQSGRGVQRYVIKVCKLLATGRWFSPGPPVFSTNKTDRPRFNWNIVESGIKQHQTNKQTNKHTYNLYNKANVFLNIENNFNRRFCIDTIINVRE